MNIPSNESSSPPADTPPIQLNPTNPPPRNASHVSPSSWPSTRYDSSNNNNSTPSQSPNTPPLTTYRIDPCLLFFSVIFASLIFINIATSPNPIFAILFVVLSLLPAALIWHFIRTRLYDEAVPTSFLIAQFLWGAVPLSFGVLIVEVIATVIIVLVVLQKYLPAMKHILEAASSSSSEDSSSLQQPLSEILEKIPFWRIFLLLLLMSFVVAALTEETGKWMIARRYRKVNTLPDNMQGMRSITARGVVAIAMMSALGFATAENVMYALQPSHVARRSFIVLPIKRIAMTLLRDLLAFPIHVGTTTYIALAAIASRGAGGGDGGCGVEGEGGGRGGSTYVVGAAPGGGGGTSLMMAVVVAITFHGLFDAVAMVGTLLLVEEMIPEWTEGFVLLLQIALVVALIVLGRRRFRKVVEWERVATAEETAGGNDNTNTAFV